jgi:hypothetical protein
MVQINANEVVCDPAHPVYVLFGRLLTPEDRDYQEWLSIQRGQTISGGKALGDSYQVHGRWDGATHGAHDVTLRVELRRDSVILHADYAFVGELGGRDFEVRFALNDPEFERLRGVLPRPLSAAASFVDHSA